YVALQKLPGFPRTGRSVPRRRLQPAQPSHVGQPLKPGHRPPGRPNHRYEVLPEQHARRTLPSVVFEIQLLISTSPRERITSRSLLLLPLERPPNDNKRSLQLPTVAWMSPNSNAGLILLPPSRACFMRPGLEFPRHHLHFVLARILR